MLQGLPNKLLLGSAQRERQGLIAELARWGAGQTGQRRELEETESRDAEHFGSRVRSLSDGSRRRVEQGQR